MKKPSKEEVPKPYKCMLCGDKGMVYRAYVEKDVDMSRARSLVPCPKCVKKVMAR